jgi:hypothetical protein
VCAHGLQASSRRAGEATRCACAEQMVTSVQLELSGDAISKYLWAEDGGFERQRKLNAAVVAELRTGQRPFSYAPWCASSVCSSGVEG